MQPLLKYLFRHDIYLFTKMKIPTALIKELPSLPFQEGLI